METLKKVTAGASTTDQKFIVGVVICLLILAIWLYYSSRAIPTLTEGMTKWRMPRFVNGRIEMFTARDTQQVMSLAADPTMTWDKFNKATATLGLHPYTFVRLQDYAKKGQLSQVITAQLISADHTLKR